VLFRSIAGSSLEEAINVVKGLNANGMMATLDLLGEEVTNRSQSVDASNQYIKMLDEIDRLKLDCNISIKPTHMGLNLNEKFGFETIKTIVEHAAKLNNFVRIDMEDHTVTDTTIEFFHNLSKKYSNNVGTVLQAYLKRTESDIKNLACRKANLRLCKGIYVESENIAFKQMSKINASYKKCLDTLLEKGCYVGIATHDEELVLHAFKSIEKFGVSRDKYEFQMLLGVTENLRDEIIERGHRLRVYVPYGEDWYQYSMRRLKENPRMAGMIFKNILGLNSRKHLPFSQPKIDKQAN